MDAQPHGKPSTRPDSLSHLARWTTRRFVKARQDGDVVAAAVMLATLRALADEAVSRLREAAR